MRILSALALSASVLTLPGCKTWADAREHTLTIKAPEKVNRGEEFVFSVTVKNTAGEEIPKIAFQWSIDWVDLAGSVHKGRAGRDLQIRVKGSPGTATLHILGYDANGTYGELARQSFHVE